MKKAKSITEESLFYREALFNGGDIFDGEDIFNGENIFDGRDILNFKRWKCVFFSLFFSILALCMISKNSAKIFDILFME